MTTSFSSSVHRFSNESREIVPEDNITMEQRGSRSSVKNDVGYMEVSQTTESSLLKNKKILVFVKLFSLTTLTIQNALLAMSMRYSRTRPVDMFYSTTAVLLTEVLKLFICLILVLIEEKGCRKWITALHSTVIRNPIDTLKVCFVAILYLVQNNLLYLAASHLDATTYQVTFQLKILTTAMFSVIMLKRRLTIRQWVSLAVLITGIALVQLANSTDSAGKDSAEQSRVIGFTAILASCVLSGFAGVYFEMMLKETDISIWMRNVQLSCLSIPFGLMMCFAKDWDNILANGFFFGYDMFVVYIVLLQAAGGLIVAVVVKYADNILKGFATSLAIVISTVGSIHFFGFNLSVEFLMGAILVIASIFLYNIRSHKPKPVNFNSSNANCDDRKV